MPLIAPRSSCAARRRLAAVTVCLFSLTPIASATPGGIASTATMRQERAGAGELTKALAGMEERTIQQAQALFDDLRRDTTLSPTELARLVQSLQGLIKVFTAFDEPTSRAHIAKLLASLLAVVRDHLSEQYPGVIQALRDFTWEPGQDPEVQALVNAILEATQTGAEETITVKGADVDQLAHALTIALQTLLSKLARPSQITLQFAGLGRPVTLDLDRENDWSLSSEASLDALVKGLASAGFSDGELRVAWLQGSATVTIARPPLVATAAGWDAPPLATGAEETAAGIAALETSLRLLTPLIHAIQDTVATLQAQKHPLVIIVDPKVQAFFHAEGSLLTYDLETGLRRALARALPVRAYGSREELFRDETINVVGQRIPVLQILDESQLAIAPSTFDHWQIAVDFRELPEGQRLPDLALQDMVLRGLAHFRQVLPLNAKDFVGLEEVNRERYLSEVATAISG